MWLSVVGAQLKVDIKLAVSNSSSPGPSGWIVREVTACLPGVFLEVAIWLSLSLTYRRLASRPLSVDRGMVSWGLWVRVLFLSTVRPPLFLCLLSLSSFPRI